MNKPIRQTHFKLPTIPQAVEQADAASRLTIAEVNNVGTNRTGISLPMIPSGSDKISIINSYFCLTGTDSGLYLVQRTANQPSQVVPFNAESIFCKYYNDRDAIYICGERGLDTQSLNNLAHGRFIRYVYEDIVASQARDSGGRISIGRGFLHSLPVKDGANLVELDACDDFGNVYALKAFRFVEDNQWIFILPFKPAISGIGELNNVPDRKPQIILNMDHSYVLEHPKERHTWLSLYNGLKGMVWSSLKDFTCGLSCSPSNLDRNDRKTLLNVLANAAEQGVFLSLVDGDRSIAQNDFINQCIGMGMDIPSVLDKHNLLVQKSVPHIVLSDLPRFWEDGPVTVFSIQPQYTLRKVVTAVAKTIRRNMLIIIPEDVVFYWRRTVPSLDKQSSDKNTRSLVADTRLSDNKAFTRAVFESGAEIVLMAGFRQDKDSCILKVLNWCGEFGLPVGVFYEGDGNEVNEDDYYLYDNVFYVNRLGDGKQNQRVELSFWQKKPETHKYLGINSRDSIVEVDKSGMPIEYNKTFSSSWWLL